jgi:hypothetical protein
MLANSNLVVTLAKIWMKSQGKSALKEELQSEM